MAIEYTYDGLSGNIMFNFSTQIISCENTIVTLEIQELVDACREAEYSSIGIAFPKICNASGKDYLDVDNGVQVGITIVLLDEWVVYTEKNTGVFKVIGGNLVQVSGGDPFAPNPLVTYVNIQSAASTVVSISSGSGLSTEEHNKLMEIPAETLTEERYIDLFHRRNTIVGTETSKRITESVAGTEAGGGEVVMAVTYDSDDEYALPIAEVQI